MVGANTCIAHAPTLAHQNTLSLAGQRLSHATIPTDISTARGVVYNKYINMHFTATLTHVLLTIIYCNDQRQETEVFCFCSLAVNYIKPFGVYGSRLVTNRYKLFNFLLLIHQFALSSIKSRSAVLTIV